MSLNFYILENEEIVRVDTVIEWATWLEGIGRTKRIVSATSLPGGVFVSTVFLGLDHNYSHREHAPVLFETMVFGGPDDSYQERYCTLKEAREGHIRTLRMCRGGSGLRVIGDL